MRVSVATQNGMQIVVGSFLSRATDILIAALRVKAGCNVKSKSL